MPHCRKDIMNAGTFVCVYMQILCIVCSFKKYTNVQVPGSNRGSKPEICMLINPPRIDDIQVPKEPHNGDALIQVSYTQQLQAAV